jgi:hypothetical protein
MFHPKHVERLAGNNKILYKSVILLELFGIEVKFVAICRVILHIQKKKLDSYIFKHQILKPA